MAGVKYMEYIENHKFISLLVVALIVFWLVQSAMITNHVLNWTIDSSMIKATKLLLVWCLPPIPMLYWSYKYNIWFFGGGGGSGGPGSDINTGFAGHDGSGDSGC